MTDIRDEESDLLAAEYAIGLLDGDELRQARVRAAVDPDFADRVGWWESRLAPLLDEIGETTPAPDLRERVMRAVASAHGETGNVVSLDRQARRWRTYGLAMTAVAASLALVVGYEATRQAPAPVAQPVPVADVLVATLSSDQAETSLAVAYDRQRSSLLISPGRLDEPSGRTRQLWIIPAGGSPVSLGLIRAGAPQRLAVPATVGGYFRAEATIAVSDEPLGGSPTGQPTGAVLAAGPLVRI